MTFVLFIFHLTASDCQACEEADTYENIMDNYCRADFGQSLIFFYLPNKDFEFQIEMILNLKNVFD